MSNRNGVWSLIAQYQAIADTDWTMAPGAPTGLSTSVGSEQVTVSFTAPSFTGIPAGITEFKVTSSEGETATGSSSPITVTGLTNGTAHTFTVQAQNAVGLGAGATTSSVTPQLQRMLIKQGTNNAIHKVDIPTTGNSSDYGDLNVATYHIGAMGNSSRTIFVGGSVGGDSKDHIQFKDPASSGNCSDFGDLTTGRNYCSGLSNSTRGIACSGKTDGGQDNSDVIDYVTIGSTGNATDFGDMTAGYRKARTGASPTRGIIAAGYSTQGATGRTIMYITIASAGNATDFGDLTSGGLDGGDNYGAACSSSTRMVIGSSASSKKIDYITIASTGDA